MVQQPDQYVSSNFKMTDKKWGMEMTNFVIDLASSFSNKSDVQKYLDAANGIVDKATYKYVLATYNTAQGKKEDMPGTIRDVDFLKPIKDRYMGEFIGAYHNYQVFANDPDVVLKRNAKIGEKVYEMLMQKLVNELNAKGVETGKESKEVPDIDKWLATATEDWSDDQVIDGQKRLDLLNALVDAKGKYIQAYFYWWACEEFYSYREVHKNDVNFDIISPLEYFRVPSGNQFVEDDDFGMRKYKLSLPQVIDRFREELSEKEMKYLTTLNNTRTGNNTAIVDFEMIMQLDDFAQRNINRQSGSFRKSFTDKLWCTEIYHAVYKTPIKVGILTFMAPSGKVEEMEVDTDYEFDSEAGDIDIKWDHINQFWESYRIGPMDTGIYIKPRPIEVQREKFNDSSICKNPYNGISYLMKDNEKAPIPYRVLPYLALYRIYTLQQERAIAKFKSWIMLPESLLSDTDEMTTEERLDQANKDGTLPYDDTANANVANGVKEVATQAIVQYVQIIDGILARLKADAWEVSNMNNARVGADKGGQAGKAVTEYSYNQALTGSVWHLEIFNNFRERDYMANLDYSKVAWLDGKQGSFVDPNTNEVVYVKVDGENHLSQNLGVFVRNSNELDAMAKQLKEVAFAAAQNGNEDIAVEAITNKNISQLKQLVKDAAKAKRDFELQMKDIEGKNNIQVQQVAQQTKQLELDAKRYEVDGTWQNNIDVALLETDRTLAEWELRMTQDTNGNGYVSGTEMDTNAVEATKKVIADQKQALAERKQAFAETKFNKEHALKQKIANKPKPTTR